MTPFDFVFLLAGAIIGSLFTYLYYRNWVRYKPGTGNTIKIETATDSNDVDTIILLADDIKNIYEFARLKFKRSKMEKGFKTFRYEVEYWNKGYLEFRRSHKKDFKYL